MISWVEPYNAAKERADLGRPALPYVMMVSLAVTLFFLLSFWGLGVLLGKNIPFKRKSFGVRSLIYDYIKARLARQVLVCESAIAIVRPLRLDSGGDVSRSFSWRPSRRHSTLSGIVSDHKSKT